eukprot:5678303-Pleurochrysis_carterae.AAC.1
MRDDKRAIAHNVQGRQEGEGGGGGTAERKESPSEWASMRVRVSTRNVREHAQACTLGGVGSRERLLEEASARGGTSAYVSSEPQSEGVAQASNKRR